MGKKFIEYMAYLIVASVLIWVLTSCGSDERADKQPGVAQGQDVSELVRYYTKMKETGLAGKVDEFLAMRDSVTNVEVAQYYERKGWVLDSSRVSAWSFNWPDVTGLPLEQDSSDGEWRRLIFGKHGIISREGVEQSLYLIIIWRLNGDVWKVSNATIVAADKYKADSSLFALEDLSFHPMFHIPPSFDVLRPPEHGDDSLAPIKPPQRIPLDSMQKR